MIEQIGNALKFRVFFVASKVGAAGLTVTVDLYGPDDTAIASNQPAAEIGGGLYSYTLSAASVTTAGEYLAVFKTASAAVDQQHVPSIWVVGRAGVEHLDEDVSVCVLDPDEIADAVLTRDWTAILDVAPDYCAWQALRSLRCSRDAPAGGIFTVYEEDSVTIAWTATLSTDADALPVDGVTA